MIYHQSPYGQTLKFSSELYYKLSDEELSEIEIKCSGIEREFITISNSNYMETDEEDIDFEL